MGSAPRKLFSRRAPDKSARSNDSETSEEKDPKEETPEEGTNSGAEDDDILSLLQFHNREPFKTDQTNYGDTQRLLEMYDSLETVVKQCAEVQDVDSNALTSCLEHIDAFGAISRDHPDSLREKWAERLAELGVVEIWLNLWPLYWSTNFTEQGTSYLALRKLNFTFVVRILWNGSDCSKTICQQFTRQNGLKLLVNKLKEKEFEPPKLELNHSKRYFASGMLSILCNCMRQYSEAKRSFRSAQGLTIMLPFSKAANVVIKTKSIFALAYSVNEDQRHLLKTMEVHMDYMLELLEQASAAEDHRSHGFSAEELILALNRLIANESNKLLMVQRGAAALYVKFLKDCVSDSEVLAAVNGLWLMSFADENKSKISLEPDCVSSLEELKLHRNISISQAATGTLWTLSLAVVRFKKGCQIDQEQSNGPQKKFSTDSTATVNGEMEPINSDLAGHIMISYNWDYKSIVLQLKDKLEAAGYRIWMDQENMTGSLLEAMAHAIEKASLVIVCLSESYKDSPSCRTEAEYVFRLHKQILPIQMQTSYDPEGWLGALVGNQLYFKGSNLEDLVESLPRIIREINQKLCSVSNQPIISAVTQSINIPSYVSKWSPEKVRSWLELDLALSENTLEKFANFEGKQISALQNMYKKAPSSFYNSLTGQYGMKLMDVLTLADALDKL